MVRRQTHAIASAIGLCCVNHRNIMRLNMDNSALFKEKYQEIGNFPKG